MLQFTLIFLATIVPVFGRSTIVQGLFATNVTSRAKTAREISDWPIDTFGYGIFSSQMNDVRIKLNDECISSNRRGSLYLSRKCDRWEIKSLPDGYLVLRNTDTDQHLTSNSYGDAYITSYTGQDEQAWFIATNLKSTRLFNKLSKEYLDRDQGGKIVTSPFYGKFQRADKIIVVNSAKTVLSIDTN